MSGRVNEAAALASQARPGTDSGLASNADGWPDGGPAGPGGRPDPAMSVPAASAAYRISRPVPALLHEDPLFLGLCAAFDDLLSPIVAALDCFSAYLDPWLAPEDFLGWLGGLVGVTAGPAGQSRAVIAGAVRAYRCQGTAGQLRQAVAAAAEVPPEQVSVAEAGCVTWSQTPGAAVTPPFDSVVTITVAVPSSRDQDAVAACARAAAGPAVPVFSQLRIEVVSHDRV